MVVTTQEYDIPAAVPRAKLFKAIATDMQNLFPKIVDAIQSIEFTEGNAGPGTIRKITIIDGEQTKDVLHRVDAIDEANCVYNFSIIGGTGLPDTLEKIQFESQLVKGPNGGSLGKARVKFFSRGDARISEFELMAIEAVVKWLVELVEGYLLANPDY